MAGAVVARTDVDYTAVRCILALRDALTACAPLIAWLNAQHSDAEGGDPLTNPLEPIHVDPNDEESPMTTPGVFAYTADEAYLLRSTFQGIANSGLSAILETARPLTGLS
jgi:hypothetical protein